MTVAGDDSLRRILDSSPDLVSVIDRAGVFRYANAAHAPVLGIEPAALLGTPAFDIVHPEDQPLAALRLLDIYNGLQTMGVGIPLRLRRHDGTWAQVEIIGASLQSGDGEDAGLVLATRAIEGLARAEDPEIVRLASILRAQNDAMTDGILIVSPGGDVVSCNQKFLDLWGFPSREAASRVEDRGRRITALVKQQAQARETLANIHADPRATLDRVAELVDGRFVEIRTAPLIGSADQIYGRAWFFRDVTQRIESEHELAASEDRYRRLVELSPNGIGVHQDGVLRYVNDAALRLLNAGRDDILGRNVFEFVHQDDQQTVILAALEQHFDAPRFVEVRMLRPDGGELIVEVASSATTFNGGPATQTVLRDITDRRMAEAAKRESDERYRSLVESAPDAIYVHDGKQIVYANKAAAALLGFRAPENVHGLDPYDLMRGIDRQTFEDRMERLRAGETMRLAERRFLTFAGREADLEIALAPASFGGSPVVQVMLRDVTDRRLEAEKRLALERKMLETQKLESLGVLAGGIAHDFNNLLVAIMGNAGLAMLETQADSPIADYLHEIETASQRAADLARQMLAYSGKGRFVVEPLDMNTVVTEMANLLAVSMPKKATLQFALEAALPAVEADPTQVRQVVMNVVINAAEALGGESGSITIATSVVNLGVEDLEHAQGGATSPGAYVSFKVTDTGCGMDAATKARIFDPFFTTKFTGRGLGLAAVLGIVRGHHGLVRVDSADGQGTSFEVLVPALPGPAPQPSELAETRQPERFHGAALIIDDEASVRRVIEGMLERLGFGVDSVADGDEALKRLANGMDPALLLIDMTMPGLAGDEVLRAIRAKGFMSPAVVMSGYSEEEATARFPGEPVAFLQKPFTFEDLAAAVAKSLGNPVQRQ